MGAFFEVKFIYKGDGPICGCYNVLIKRESRIVRVRYWGFSAPTGACSYPLFLRRLEVLGFLALPKDASALALAAEIAFS